MDIILETSRRFYQAHHLAEWAAAIPDQLAQPPDAAEVARAQKQGLTGAFVFPPFDVQLATLDRLIDETARKPAPVPDNQQYSEPFLADSWSKTPNGRILQQTDDPGPRVWGPYLLLYTPNPVQSAWGRTGKQIRELFDSKGWHGLTVPEYLVLQRFLCEKHLDHRFFEKPEDDSGAHSMWLIDSMTDRECSVAQGNHRGINIQATSISNRDSRRAALATVVIAL